MPRQHNTQTKALPCSNSWHLLRMVRQLGRAELSAMVALSALTGQLFAAQQWTITAPLVTLAVLLLAVGASALNQWQERDLDGRMARTCSRPLPSGNLSAQAALAFALSCLGCGLLLLCLFHGFLPLLLGLLAIIWYNAIYTPLKRHSVFAALPGAICGALPPVIGWAATGAPLLDSKILILAGTLFVWQIPHSWLLLCHYRQDLQQSGLPNLFETISVEQLLRINNCWLIALAICYLQFPLFGFIKSPLLIGGFLAGLSAITLKGLSEIAKKTELISPIQLFHLTNLSMALLLTVLLLDSTVL